MSIDFNVMIQNKINEMEENEEIKKHFENALRKLILDSVSSALNGYNFRRKIEEKVESQVAPCLDSLNFTAYNSFICQKIKQITEEYLQEDMAKKVSETFENIFVLKRESIKLSEIFAMYRDWLISGLDDHEQYELDNEFYASVEKDDRYGHWLDCSFAKEAPTTSYLGVERKSVRCCDFGFIVNTANPHGGKIISVYFEGKSVNDIVKVKSYNKIQSLLLNLYYNETPIIIDVESDDDIDTSLGLDY